MMELLWLDVMTVSFIANNLFAILSERGEESRFPCFELNDAKGRFTAII